MPDCYSYVQRCSLGPIPPRTPGRADAQVPKDKSAGTARHGRIGHFYFYANGSQDDPAFGFVDIEISVQSAGPSEARVEAYCVGDGYQSVRGHCGDRPMRIELLAGDRLVRSVKWHYPDVLCGHADPISFSTVIDLPGREFEQIDGARLAPVSARAHPCE
jgi:hypothetical protein